MEGISRETSLALWVLLAGCGAGSHSAVDGAVSAESDGGQDARSDGTASDGPVVILMIGDGMGPGQLEAASIYRSGRPGTLYLQGLPHHGRISTASLSGTTDSGAAATTMASGVRTFNGREGLDRHGQPAENLVELAHRLGRSAGIVTTALLPHATPGGFSAHRMSRNDYVLIAEDQVLRVQPDVMLGGGSAYFRPAGEGSQRSDGGLLSAAAEAGYQVVATADELAAIQAGPDRRVLGIFAADHMDYVRNRAATTTQPTLAEMSRAALRILDGRRHGFFLMIEGARIDMACHAQDLEDAVAETLAFDDAVQAVGEWAEGHEDVTLLVTADHETGGLTVTTPHEAGTLPEVGWRWFKHTNAIVDAYGQGPGTERLDADPGAILDHAWEHAILAGALEERPAEAPVPVLVPDGLLDDLRWTAAQQTVASGFGEGFNELDDLRIDADADGLGLGIEGVFEWGQNALVLLVDVDYGQATGPARLAGALDDRSGRVDSILSSLRIDAPAALGFGADFAVVSWGGTDPRDEDVFDDAGLRGLRAPFGDPSDLAWFAVATDFADGTRARDMALTSIAGRGFEAYLPWTTLYPDRSGRVPEDAVIAIAAILVNDDGSYTSNQALPGFPAGTGNPGGLITPLPGLVVFPIDSDGDGVGDGERPQL